MTQFVTVPKWIFESILRKTGGKPQTDDRGVRWFNVWSAAGKCTVYEASSPEDPN